jgi:hypothetical protein
MNYIQDPELRRYTGESLCQGATGHILCSKYNRSAPGKKTGRHFLENPATDPKKCRCYLPVKNQKNGVEA